MTTLSTELAVMTQAMTFYINHIAKCVNVLDAELVIHDPLEGGTWIIKRTEMFPISVLVSRYTCVYQDMPTFEEVHTGPIQVGKMIAKFAALAYSGCEFESYIDEL